MAGRQDEHRLSFRTMEGVEHHRLLARHGRAGEEDRPPTGQLPQGRLQLRLAGGLRSLVFEIAGDGDAAGVDPQGQEAVAVLPALDAEAADAGEQGSEEGTQAAHPREAAVADPAVDDGDR